MIKSKNYKLFQIVAHAILILVVISVALPFVLLFMSSITEEISLLKNGYSFFPKKISLNAYLYILRSKSVIYNAYIMTFIVTIIGTAGNILLSTMLAYGLSIKNLPGKKVLSFFVFFTMLFNGGLVPTYLMYTNMFHIKNTVFALIIPSLLMNAMNVLLIRSFYTSSIPEALYEAAKIDGAGHIKIFGVIVWPLGKPIMVTMGLFSALTYWNDWSNGLYYLSGMEGEKLYTIQNVLNEMITKIEFLSTSAAASAAQSELSKVPSVSVRMAIAFVAMLPMLIIYPSLQKYFQKGIALGAVKG